LSAGCGLPVAESAPPQIETNRNFSNTKHERKLQSRTETSATPNGVVFLPFFSQKHQHFIKTQNLFNIWKSVKSVIQRQEFLADFLTLILILCFESLPELVIYLLTRV